jgi:hypothetical protein
MSNAQDQDPFGRDSVPPDPFSPEGAGNGGHTVFASRNERELADRLLAQGSIRDEIGTQDLRLEVFTQLSENHREIVYRVTVLEHGKEVEDPLGEYPTEKRFGHDSVAAKPTHGQVTAERRRRTAAINAARCHLEICARAQHRLPKEQGLSRPFFWIFVGLLLGFAAFASVRLFVWPANHEDPEPPQNCNVNPRPPDCPEPPTPDESTEPPRPPQIPENAEQTRPVDPEDLEQFF